MYTKSIMKEFFLDRRYMGPTDTVSRIVQGTRSNKVSDAAIGYDASFSTAFNTQVYFDYKFKKGKVKQIRHLLIPTLTYNYRPDFGESQYGFWKKVQYDTLGRTQNYSIFERSIFGGPGIGKTNGLGINLNNTIDAKLKQKTDTGITFKKVALLQNLGLSTFYNFAADSFKMSDVVLSARTTLLKNINVTLNSVFSPYAYDKGSGRLVNKFAYEYDRRLARFTGGNISVSSSIGSNMIAAARKAKQAPELTNGAERGAQNDLNREEKLPWNLNMSYVLTLTNAGDRKIQPIQTLNFSGDIMPTKFWKLGVTSGFDFNTQKLSYTSFNIYRDLKCWEARIGWIPFGFNRGYNFTLNIKAAMLSEFKVPRKSNSLDNAQLRDLFNN